MGEDRTEEKIPDPRHRIPGSSIRNNVPQVPKKISVPWDRIPNSSIRPKVPPVAKKISVPWDRIPDSSIRTKAKVPHVPKKRRRRGDTDPRKRYCLVCGEPASSHSYYGAQVPEMMQS